MTERLSKSIACDIAPKIPVVQFSEILTLFIMRADYEGHALEHDSFLS